MIDSDDFESLGPDSFVVFSGTYAEAQPEALARSASRARRADRAEGPSPANVTAARTTPPSVAERQ